ncbi:predicted protein [Verticillium alfalfae VaMs.102]|uniref:Predicted protein n=1 Tax=Verticillium alfalfae (strain VaMs.102 / ATCC MYA-4576 / FGSC 10136) TaxID=526221 RepID=C9S7R0_VERA1|nr:predicted protein [Verticillium alfalfae VaMs.102]EEY14795.1 predicted protein [Verticillium alfalfae VaMs.102]
MSHCAMLRDAHHTPRQAPSPDMLGAAHVFSGHDKGGTALAALHLEPCIKVQRQVLEGRPLSADGRPSLGAIDAYFQSRWALQPFNLHEWPNSSSVYLYVVPVAADQDLKPQESTMARNMLISAETPSYHPAYPPLSPQNQPHIPLKADRGSENGEYCQMRLSLAASLDYSREQIGNPALQVPVSRLLISLLALSLSDSTQATVSSLWCFPFLPPPRLGRHEWDDEAPRTSHASESWTTAGNVAAAGVGGRNGFGGR